jgi:formate transporter
VTFAQWWLWNQIPVTLGNLVGGFVFTGLALYVTHKPRAAAPAPMSAMTRVPAE